VLQKGLMLTSRAILQKVLRWNRVISVFINKGQHGN
jgi:hypothetical protein